MTTKNLYVTISEDGGTIISTAKPEGDYIPYLQIASEEGMVLTNGTIQTTIVDIPAGDESLWTEIEDPEGELTPDELYAMIAEVL